MSPADCQFCQRLEQKEEATCQKVSLLPENILRQDQQSDMDTRHLLQAKESRERPSWQEIVEQSRELKILGVQWDSLRLDGGLLKRALGVRHCRSVRLQTIILRKRISEVLKSVHDRVSGGHHKVTKTLAKIRDRCNWPTYKEDVEDWCRRCTTCASVKGPHTRSRSQMWQYNVRYPFECITMDIAGPFPLSDDGNRYALCVSNYFSKWPDVYSLPSQDSEVVTRTLINNWISRFGVKVTDV